MPQTGNPTFSSGEPRPSAMHEAHGADVPRSERWARHAHVSLASLLLALSLLVSLAPCLLAPLPSCQGEENERVPPFRRLLLSPEQLEDELKRVKDGVLVRLPLAEFDELIQRATPSTARKETPRLLEARYHATLKEESLVGEGQWKLVHTASTPGLLNLEPFNLALRQARFENGDALIAAFDGKTPALLVESAGERTLSLDWSARAESGREGTLFHLEIPPCPVALLELDIPAGRSVAVLNDGALLTGPHEAETAELHRWKIVCGGRRIDIRILSSDPASADADQTVAPLVRQKTTQKLHPQGLDATFELTLDGLTRGVRRLVCECDAELRLREVVGPNVEAWSLESGNNDKPSRLTIRLREPMRTGTWQISCLAPLNRTPSSAAVQPIAWQSPRLRLVNGVPHGETLTLWIDPELQLESWDAGSFRLTSSDLDRASGAQVLTLLGGGLGPPRRPSARLHVHEVEFRTHQLAWWRCDASGMMLTVQVAWDVSLGQLFQLAVQLPTDWRVEKVEMSPKGLLRDWRVRSTAGKSTLFVDLASPLFPRGTGDSERTGVSTRTRLPSLSVQLRPGWSGPVTGKKLPLPDAVPLGARFRDGALALDCDEQLFHLDVRTVAERSQPEGEGPWGTQFPEYYYRYRVSSASDDLPIKGELQVRARPPRLRAKCTSEVFVSSGRAAVDTQLALEAEAGSPETIDLTLAGGDGGEWQWRSEAAPRGDETNANRVQRVERLYRAEIATLLPGITARNPLLSAVLFAARPSGERWRLTLARPLRGRETLRLHAQRYLQARDNRWNVPLPVVLGADRMEGEVTLHLAGEDLVQLRTFGLSESASPTPKGGTPWRTFRYGQSEVGLSLSAQSLSANPASKAAIDAARLVTYVGAEGELRHHFSFHVSNWNQHSLSLGLPPRSRPLAVQVDGRWLPRLIPATTEEREGASQGMAGIALAENEKDAPIELALPVPAPAEGVPGETVHYFEVVYTRPAPAWMPWQTLEAPVPRLPVTPLSFRHVWRLTPMWMPLHQGRYQALPGSAATKDLPAFPRHFAELFQLAGLWTRLDPLREDPQAGTREALEQAIQELHGRYTERKLSLREAVSSIAFVSLRDHYCLLIDALALREAGVEPNTSLTLKRPGPDKTVPPWSECGLVAVPGRSAILLTTRSGHGASLRDPLSEDVEKALAAAATYGQDPTGRFQGVLHWLYPDSATVAASSKPRWLDLESEPANWSEWEPIAGQSEDQLTVVHRNWVSAAGMTLVFLLGLVFWILRRSSVRLRLLLLLLILALSGLYALWLPAALRDLAWWPLTASCGGAAWWYLQAVVRTTRNTSSVLRNSSKILALVVGGLLLLGLFGWHGQAAVPAPTTVYLVPAFADTPEKPTVLVPVDLLDRLRELACPAPLASGGPWSVLLDAAYEGQLVDEGKQAEFTALFSAHSLTEEASLLPLPLFGVQLIGEVFLDGARIDPLALSDPRGGYLLKVRGRGRHKIELRFRSPVVGTAEDRNVLFTAPPLVRSRLSWHVGTGASEPQVLVKYGGQSITRDAGGERLDADLGALPRPVHLHWYQPGQATRVTYQAAYLWDLDVETNQLTAWLRYHVPQGAVKKLEVELPAELEVSSATAQRILPATPPPWLARFQLRDWYVRRSGGQRTLHLELPYPISGEFQVALELLPRTALPARAMLPLPSPHEVAEAGPHYLAYRTRVGLSAQRDTSQFLTRISETEFAPDWPGVPRLGARFTGVAYRITPNQTPKLFLRLRQAPPVVEAEIDVTVQASTHVADLQAVAEIKAPNKDLALVEWELPSPRCTITAVAGEEVRTWKQNGSRLLVWLSHMTEATRIRLSGWVPVNPQGERSHLALDALRLQQSGKQRTRLHLLAGTDQALVSVQTRNLQAVKSESRTRESALEYETSELAYHVDCEVQSAGNAVARVLTLAEVADRELRFSTTIHYTIRHGELRHVQFRLRNWDEEKVEVQADNVSLWPGPRRFAGERSWLLPLQPGITRSYQVSLRGSMPLDKAAVGVPMPEVLVQGVDRPEYYLAVAGGELTGQAKGSLQSLTTPTKELQRFWPGAAQRLERTGGQAWRVPNAEWQLRLLPHPRTLEPAPVRLFLLEHSMAVVDGQHWLHEVRCWLRHEAHSDLSLDFPAPVRVLAAAVDGLEVTPLPSGPTRVWLALPGRPGVRYLHMRWMYQEPEPLHRPNLISPEIVDAIPGTALWTVRVPAGWEVSRGSPTTRLGTGPARDAALALYRAETQLQISQELAKQRRDSATSLALLDAQQRFEVCCRRAQQALDLGTEDNGATGPEGQSLKAWLGTLQARNRSLLAERGEEKDTKRRGDTEKAIEFERSSSPWLLVSGSEMEGTPISWRSSPDGKSPELELISQETQRTRHALVASGQWLGGLMVVWFLSLVPFLLTRLRLFWPEQIALLGAIGWHVAGLTSVVLLLFLAAVCGRLFLLVRGVRGLFRKRRKQPSTMTPSSAILD